MEWGGEEWICACQGNSGDVYLHPTCMKELDSLKTRDTNKLESTVENFFCELEDLQDMPPKRFNPNEGDRRGMRLAALKGGDVRVYGTVGSIDGKRTFFGTKTINKQKNRAVGNDLDTAGDRLAPLKDVESIEI